MDDANRAPPTPLPILAERIRAAMARQAAAREAMERAERDLRLSLVEIHGQPSGNGAE
jgi:hypothetical protein